MAVVLSQQCVISWLILLVGALVVAYVVYPALFSAPEGFDPTSEEHMESMAEEESPAPEGVPEIDPSSGVLMDGPGFEAGQIEGAPEVTSTSIPSNYYFLDDGANGEMSIQHNLCSKSCCSEQWPTPFKQKYDPYVCGLKAKGELVPTNIMCNNTFQDSGCLCATKDQFKFLYNRGANGREWF